MTELIAFYHQEKKRFEIKRDLLKRRINLVSLIRIGLFLFTLITSYYTFETKILFISLIIFSLVGFVFLVLKYQNLTSDKELCEELIRINNIEMDALNGEYSDLPTGSEFIDDHHFYSNDIDLFGKGSFFQYMNRTATGSGAETLAQVLLENNPDEIIQRQEVIKELSQKVSWRQRFLALANMVKVEVDHKTIISWIKNYESFSSFNNDLYTIHFLCTFFYFFHPTCILT